MYKPSFCIKNVLAIAFPLGTSLNTKASSFLKSGSICSLDLFITSPSVETNFELTTIYLPSKSIEFSCAFPFLYEAT